MNKRYIANNANLYILKNTLLLLLIIASLQSCKEHDDYTLISDVPDLIMPDNGLRFKKIKDYKNYKIVATHYVTDNDELRYILANEKAYKALYEKQDFPEGSILVNIAWSVKKCQNLMKRLKQMKFNKLIIQ